MVLNEGFKQNSGSSVLRAAEWVHYIYRDALREEGGQRTESTEY